MLRHNIFANENARKVSAPLQRTHPRRPKTVDVFYYVWRARVFWRTAVVSVTLLSVSYL